MKNKFSNLTEGQLVEIAKVINPDLDWSYEGFFDDSQEHFLMGDGETSLHIYNIEPANSPWGDEVLQLRVFDDDNHDEMLVELSSEILDEIDEMVNKWTSHIGDTKEVFLNKFDNAGQGKLELLDVNDVQRIIQNNQKKIAEFDKKYIHQFVKIINYIKAKERNVLQIHSLIKTIENNNELTDSMNQIENQKHLHDILVFHALNMITALLDDDFLTFYEIYETLDKLNIFNSNWENEVSEKLTFIGNKLNDLMLAIYNMEQNITMELGRLTYLTQESFAHLNSSVSNQLRDVQSSIDFNNLLTVVQSYQLNNINKHTKKLGS